MSGHPSIVRCDLCSGEMWKPVFDGPRVCGLCWRKQREQGTEGKR